MPPCSKGHAEVTPVELRTRDNPWVTAPKPSLLYLVRKKEIDAVKVGITNSPKRLAGHIKMGWEPVLVVPAIGRHAKKVETTVCARWRAAGLPMVNAAQGHLRGGAGVTETAPLAVEQQTIALILTEFLRREIDPSHACKSC